MPRALDIDMRRSSSADDLPLCRSAERDADTDDDADEEGVGRLSDSGERRLSSAGGLASLRSAERDTDADEAGVGAPPDSDARRSSSAFARTESRDVLERDTDTADGGSGREGEVISKSDFSSGIWIVPCS